MTVKRMAQLLCVIALLCGCVFAQTTTGTLTGTITDSSDAAVSQELLVSLDQREALALEGATLQAMLDAIEADIFEIDQKITAPERGERDT